VVLFFRCLINNQMDRAKNIIICQHLSEYTIID
jgi:hypothetical protein